MNYEGLMAKEDAILFAKDKMDEAIAVLEELLPEAAEELGWLRDELGKELQNVRTERLSLMESSLYGSEEVA